MPILSSEPFLFPDELFTDSAITDESVPDPDDQVRWWAVHTRPRAEKAVARRLRERQTAFFLPVYHRRMKYGRQVRTAQLPLFPGYLFLHGDSLARLDALDTSRVIRCFAAVDQPRLQADLAQLHRLITTGAPLAPEERIGVGTLVEIRRGPLAGMCGKVLRRRSELRFLVEIDFLQRGASVEIEGWMIQALAP